MKKILLMVAVAIMTTVNLNAQRIQVVDEEGQGIPLATILTEDGVMIGTTNLEGMFDMKGATKLVVTHVAYKPLVVSAASIKNGRVRMEDQDYGLTEITITPKQYIYVEVYYRVYVYRNDSLCYFLTGIMPNAYDPQKKKLEHGSYYQSYSEYCQKMGATITWGARAQSFHAGLVHKQGLTDKYIKDRYYSTPTVKSPNLKVYSNPQGTVGQQVRSGSQVRLTLDAGKMQMYANEVKGETKLLQKRKEVGYEYQYTMIYDDDEGNGYDVANFIMETNHWEYNDKKSHVKFIIENYAVDHAYVNKDEWKTKKNDLKQKYRDKVTLEQLEKYEKEHNLPALAPTIRQSILKLKRQ